MRDSAFPSSLLALAAIAVLCSACNAVGANDRQAELSEKPVANFFDTLLDIGSEPIDVRAGTAITVQLLDTLSSHATPSGAPFSAEVTQEVSIDGKVAVPVGSVIRGHVTEAHPAKKIGGRAILAVAFDELTTPAGETVGLHASLSQTGRSQVGRDAAIISGSTIGGAILGKAIDDDDGAKVGAVAGIIGGTIGALKTKGKPVVLPQGSSLRITVDRPFKVESAS